MNWKRLTTESVSQTKSSVSIYAGFSNYFVELLKEILSVHQIMYGCKNRGLCSVKKDLKVLEATKNKSVQSDV